MSTFTNLLFHINVFTAAGIQKPDLSILSDQFLSEVRGLKHKNVAAELLEKLLKVEIKTRQTHNLVQLQLFSDKLRKTFNAYHNRAIATNESAVQAMGDRGRKDRSCTSDVAFRGLGGGYRHRLTVGDNKMT